MVGKRARNAETVRFEDVKAKFAALDANGDGILTREALEMPSEALLKAFKEKRYKDFRKVKVNISYISKR